MADHETYTVEVAEGVAHLQLCQPQRRNALSVNFWSELAQTVAELDRDGATRALLLSSTGPHFSAGLDLAAFAAAGIQTDSVAARLRFRELLLAMQSGINALANASFPVLAAIQGGCIGGALDLVSASCLRYVSTDAYFVIAEIQLGMMADLGSLNRLPYLLPEAVLREMAYTGARLDAQRAHQIGFVNDICQDPITRAMQVAGTIAAQEKVAVAASKQMISYSREHPVAESLTYLNALQPAIFDIAVVAGKAAARANAMKQG